MSTRNIVPRADNDGGQIGTSAKRWSDVRTVNLNGTAVQTVQFAALTSAQNTSSQTLADVTGLASFALAAGGTYYFRVRAMVQTNATSVGILLSMNNSTAVTSINYIQRYPTSATAWTEEQVTALQGGTLPTTGPGTTNTPYWLEGNVVANAAGTFALQFRSETATQTTVEPGSYMMVQRIS